jgi:probable HAF family extracellular repeat protein
MQDLGLLPGYTECVATAINDHAEVVGYCRNQMTAKAFRWTAESGMRALGTPYGSAAIGINNHGHIVGTWNPTGDPMTNGHAFLCRDGEVEDLQEGAALAINDRGQIVGATSEVIHALLWDDQGRHDLGTLEGGYSSVAWGIGAEGLPVGQSITGGPFGEEHAVLWNSTGISNLGALDGHEAAAYAISGDLIVGRSSTAASRDTHAFLYDINGPGYPVDLNDLIPADSDWVLNFAYGVNAAGQIVGWGTVNDARRAFLLTPVPPTAPPR